MHRFQASSKRNRLWMPRNRVTCAVVLVTALYLIAIDYRFGATLAPLDTPNVIRWILIGSSILLLVFHGSTVTSIMRATTNALVPLFTIVTLVWIYFDPQAAELLRLDDRVLEDLQFAFLMIGCLCLTLTAGLLAFRRQHLATILAVAGAIVFFVVAMEEVSWFQRVLEIDTPEYLQSRNAQGELNFHNLATLTTENLYYLGGFLLLVLLPFTHGALTKNVERSRLRQITMLLPPYWLLAPFSMIAAFVSKESVTSSTHITILLGTIAIMIAAVKNHADERQWLLAGQHAASLAIVVSGATFLTLYDYPSPVIAPWMPKEYLEFIITWGVATYGIWTLITTWEHDRQHQT